MQLGTEQRLNSSLEDDNAAMGGSAPIDQSPVIRLLGPLEVELAGRPVPVAGRLRRAVLADLALHANQVLSTDRLIDDLWGPTPPTDPVNTIQVYIAQLRRLLEPHRAPRQAARVLTSVPPGYALVVDAAHLDTLEFAALLRQSHAAREEGRTVQGAAALRAALALWRGDPLPELADAEFARAPLAHLHDLRLDALEAHIQDELGLGRCEQVIGELEGLTSRNPFRERLWELRMLALYQVGRTAESLGVYQQARTLLTRELGLEPGAALRDLQRQIIERDPALEVQEPRHVTPAAPIPAEQLVGRKLELAVLDTVLERVMLGQLEVAVVTAEAGLGKSRLASELAVRGWTRGYLVASGRCFEGDAGAPFAPILECVAELTRAVDPAALRTGAQRAASVVARVLSDLHEVLGALPEPAPLPPEQDRARLFDSIARLIAAAARTAPVLLVLDDLQWADAGTLALTTFLVRAMHEAPVLLVCCYRPDEIDPADARGRGLAALEREAPVTRVVLKPLTGSDALVLVQGLLGQAADPALVHDLAARGGGHPFFLRELARAGADGALYEGQVPTAARDLVLARVRRLPLSCRRLAAAAAAFAGPFAVEIAADAAGLAEDDGLDALDSLVLAGLMTPSGSEDDRYEFVHDITRQALYATLTSARRAHLHRAVAAAAERRWSDTAQRTAAAFLAGQYAHSSSLPGVERGARHAERAAAAAEAAHAYDEAARLLELALSWTSADDALLRPRLIARLGRARLASGEEAAGLAALLEASPQIAAIEGRPAAAQALADSASYAVQRGAWDAAPDLAAAGLGYLDEEGSSTWTALKLAELLAVGCSDPAWPGLILGTPEQLRLAEALRALPTADRPPHAGTLLFLAFASRSDVLATVPNEPEALAMWAGEYTRALHLLTPMAEEAEAEGRIEAAIVHRCTQARCLNALGRFQESDAAFELGVRLLRRLPGLSIFAAHLVTVDEERSAATGSDWGRSRVDLRGVLDPRSLRWYDVAGRAAAARILANRGSTDEAMERLAPALAAIDRAPAWSENYLRILHAAAEVHWLASRDDFAALLERNTRDKLLPADFRYPMTDVRLTLARLAAVQGRLDEAVGWFNAARTVLDEQLALPLRVVVDHDHGVVEARRGHPAAASALLGEALQQARALGMHGWAARTEEVLARLRTTATVADPAT